MHASACDVTGRCMHLTGLCMHVLHALPRDVTGWCMQLLHGLCCFDFVSDTSLLWLLPILASQTSKEDRLSTGPRCLSRLQEIVLPVAATKKWRHILIFYWNTNKAEKSFIELTTDNLLTKQLAFGIAISWLPCFKVGGDKGISETKSKQQSPCSNCMHRPVMS